MSLCHYLFPSISPYFAYSSVYLCEKIKGEDVMLCFTTGENFYLLLEAAVHASPEDALHGYIWASSRNSIECLKLEEFVGGQCNIAQNFTYTCMCVQTQMHLHTHANCKNSYLLCSFISWMQDGKQKIT